MNFKKNGNVASCNYYLLLTIVIFLFSCKKTEVVETKVDIETVEFSYEVSCNYCDISYTDVFNQNKTIKGNTGNWVYKFNTSTTFDLKLSIKTTLSNAQNIQAYILKNGEVVYGNLGYNFAEISYNTILGKGTSNFGTYTGSGTSTGSGTGGNTAPISSVCGAKNKSGGYCKRVVAGGGRCWQHK